MPSGSLVTVPVPDEKSTLRSKLTAGGLKAAETNVAEFIVTSQVRLSPEQPPDQPPKVEPPLPTAVRVTISPSGKGAAHETEQSMPGGSLVTVPEPVPATASVRSIGCQRLRRSARSGGPEWLM